MPLILVIGALVIAVGAGAYFLTDTPSTTEPVAETTEVRVEDTMPVTGSAPATDVATDSSEPDTEASDSLVDPTISSSENYEATATYLTPKRDEHIVDVSLTIENGIVTASAVAFDGLPTGEVSNPNQERFLAAYEAEVIGKPIAEVNLSRVGGASLTSQAFNDAVSQIRTEAGA